MDTEPTISPTDDNFQPSQPPQPRRLRRLWVIAAAGAVACGVALVAAAASAPEFYRARLPVGGPLDGRDPLTAAAAAEQSARRLVTRVASLHSAVLEVGRWEAAFSERELNAFLALDLPRNHAAVLPAGCRDPRIEFLPGRLRAAMRVGRGGLCATLWVEAEVTLQGANQLRIGLAQARLGLVPVPAGPVLGGIARWLERLGAVTEIRRGGGRGVLVVYIPALPQTGGASHWLEALRLAAGEAAIAGETRRGAVGPAAQR